MLHAERFPPEGEGQEIDPAHISDFLKNPEGTVWLDLTDPTDDELKQLAEEFRFHPLALEDLKASEQRPRATEYGDYVFVVAHEIHPVEDASDLDTACIRQTSQIHAFVGPHYVVTVHNAKSDILGETRKRWIANAEVRRQGAFGFLYLLLDSLVDEYYPTLDAFDERLDVLEHLVLKPANHEVSVVEREAEDRENRKPLERVLALRRSLLQMRRSVAPLRDAVNVLLRRIESLEDVQDDRAGRARALYSYYQDVYDHLIRVVETIDTYRDLLAGTLDAHLAVASNRLNEIVKVLTSVSIILMTWATITGIYGMNFEHMPELHWKYGYAYAMALMAVLGIVEWLYFRRRRWL